MCIFKQYGGNSDYSGGKMKFNRIGDSELSNIGENVANRAVISDVDSLIRDFQGWLVNNVCYRP